MVKVAPGDGPDACATVMPRKNGRGNHIWFHQGRWCGWLPSNESRSGCGAVKTTHSQSTRAVSFRACHAAA